MFNFEFTTLKVAKIVSSDLYFEFRIDITWQEVYQMLELKLNIFKKIYK
jgi:hypothetical protein